ncbi:MAG: hypothetical protein ABI882_09285 [Acidobacteriota bacterium]
MRIGRREFAGLTLLSMTGLAPSALAQGPAAQGPAVGSELRPPEEPETVTLRGRVVCLTEEYAKSYKVAADCGHRGHIYTLKTAGNRLYPFLPTDSAAAVFTDERFRERELNVTARLFPQSSFIEVITIQSWRDGKLHDLGYFCEVCNIWTHKPGPCDCCQDPVVFKETLPEN